PGAAEFKGSQSAASYAPGTLAFQTTYYWRIDEVNAQGTTTGPVWSFTTASLSSLPTISVNKSTYAPGETIVASFSNASGNSRDWVGLFAAGAANTAYIKWFYTDGTQSGNTAGIINGSLTFSGGLPNVGNYEARLFFAGTYTLRAATSFA